MSEQLSNDDGGGKRKNKNMLESVFTLSFLGMKVSKENFVEVRGNSYFLRHSVNPKNILISNLMVMRQTELSFKQN